MKQITQSVKSGQTRIADIPAPVVRPGHVLIANMASLISAGTEKMIVELTSKSLLGKARARPDHVKRVLEKIKNEGLFNTIRQVREKLDDVMPMGYSSAGIVLATGPGVQEYKPGDRVASNGPHAEVVCISRNLCAKIPDNVSYEHASFAVVGAIALQGVRLAKTNIGDTVLVIGLGLVGQLAVGILAGAGCRVIGTDLDPSKCALAKKMGAFHAAPGISASQVESLSNGLGADAIVITASTKSNGPITLAADAVRKRGRIVLVGVVGLELDRRPFYFKEAEFVVSCSYGPGRYDPSYEDKGQDYPAAYVRWTEQRNLQTVLDLIGSGRLNVAPLISHEFDIQAALDAYSMIETNSAPYVGVILKYATPPENRVHKTIALTPSTANTSSGHGIGVLGAGNFARLVLLPAIKAVPGVQPHTICSGSGVSASKAGEKLGFANITADDNAVIDHPEIKTVFSITRHDLHAQHVLRAIAAGKNIFVEKPLCLTAEELGQITQAVADKGDKAPLIMVGYNRRFSPAAIGLRSFFAKTSEPITLAYRFNAGAIPKEHWTQDDQVGGGRLLGEACHAIDFAIFITNSPVVRVYAESIAASGSGAGKIVDDQCFITLRHANGSISSIGYLAGGDKSFPKERVEVFGAGRVGVIDDYKTLSLTGSGKTTLQKLSGQDKGHNAEIVSFLSAATGKGPAPIPFDQLVNSTLAALMAVHSLREGLPVDLRDVE
jgi:predicted dehydrogenase/threonine dehydrogenase-like Zn-dependent dehydrogenase